MASKKLKPDFDEINLQKLPIHALHEVRATSRQREYGQKVADAKVEKITATIIHFEDSSAMLKNRTALEILSTLPEDHAAKISIAMQGEFLRTTFFSYDPEGKKLEPCEKPLRPIENIEGYEHK